MTIRYSDHQIKAVNENRFKKIDSIRKIISKRNDVLTEHESSNFRILDKRDFFYCKNIIFHLIINLILNRTGKE